MCTQIELEMYQEEGENYGTIILDVEDRETKNNYESDSKELNKTRCS